MTHLEIRDTAILVGYNPEGVCVYSSIVPLDQYWDGLHVWDTDTGVKGLRLEKVKGYLFGSSGELLQEFESNLQCRHGNLSLRVGKAFGRHST